MTTQALYYLTSPVTLNYLGRDTMFFCASEVTFTVSLILRSHPLGRTLPSPLPLPSRGGTSWCVLGYTSVSARQHILDASVLALPLLLTLAFLRVFVPQVHQELTNCAQKILPNIR